MIHHHLIYIYCIQVFRELGLAFTRDCDRFHSLSVSEALESVGMGGGDRGGILGVEGCVEERYDERVMCYSRSPDPKTLGTTP